MTEESVDGPGAEETSPEVVGDVAATVEETERIQTGVSEVDSVVEAVAKLAGRPVEEHAEVFESAHERLRRTLDNPPAESGAESGAESAPEPEPDQEP